jgi:GxxExxY protein
MGDFNAKVARESQRSRRPIEETGRSILDAAYKIHSALGPGLLEGSYELCLAYEIGRLGLSARRQVLIPIQYEELHIDNGYRIDLIVDGGVIVELKAIESISTVHRAQLLSYLRLGGFRLGYLLNFNVARMRDGIFRIVNSL